MATSSYLSSGVDTFTANKGVGRGDSSSSIYDPLRKYFTYREDGNTKWTEELVQGTTVIPGTSPPPADKMYVKPNVDQVALVVDALGFSKRQLAELFGVSIRDIFDWSSGGGRISRRNASRIRSLARMLSDVVDMTNRPLYHRYTTEPLEFEDQSILHLLHQNPWNTHQIMSLLSRARQKTTERLEYQARGLRQEAENCGEDTLESNLIALGVI